MPPATRPAQMSTTSWRAHASTRPRVSQCLLEADSHCMSAEADSEIIRGRPPVFSDEVLSQAAGYSYARRVRTRRGAQDLVYRMFAIAVLEHFCEAYPENEATLAWLLRPKRRHALLSELGRIARPRSDRSGSLTWSEEAVSQLVAAALIVAEARPPTKAGVAMIRAIRGQRSSFDSPAYVL